jgi:hypothetical protein
MNMNRAMGLKLYSEATDSTRGKSLRPQLFPQSQIGVISWWRISVLDGQFANLPISDRPLLLLPGSAGIPARSPMPWAGCGRDAPAPPEIGKSPKIRGPEIRPSG